MRNITADKTNKEMRGIQKVQFLLMSIDEGQFFVHQKFTNLSSYIYVINLMLYTNFMKTNFVSFFLWLIVSASTVYAC